MTPNPYDQACRYLLRLWAVPLLAWLLRLSPQQLEFVEWLDTRHVPWTGQPDRICDTVAHLRDQAKAGLPWAAVVEFQIQPDELMFGRGLSYLGDLWCNCKPTPHRGDRFEVGLIVVNLTGRGRASKRMRLTGTGLMTTLRVVERNLAALDARKVLRQVEEGKVPRVVLALLPLFKGGTRPGIISDWKRLADLEPDGEQRRALGLAVIFAEAAGRGELWRRELQEWNVIESQLVKEWQAQARKDGEIQGTLTALLNVLEARYGSLPTDLATVLRACANLETLRSWTRLAGKKPSLAEFRQEAGV